MKTLILTVGLPRSGKSTWAKAQNLPVVDPDSIRLALHGQPFIGSAEPMVWAIAKIMVRALFIYGEETVIVDSVNNTQRRRNEWRSSDWELNYMQFGGPEMEEDCIHRAKLTCKDDNHFKNLSAAIRRMAEKWEPLEVDEPLWASHHTNM